MEVTAGQPVCDQWRSQEVDVIDLANGRISRKASEEGGLGPKSLNWMKKVAGSSLKTEGYHQNI